MALRMTTAASHKMPPFTLIVGRHPMLPSHINLDDLTFPSEPTEEEELGYAALVIRETERLRTEAQKRLKFNDVQVRNALIRSERFAPPETLF